MTGELPGVGWQRCVVHFERNVPSHVPASAMGEVAEELKAIFKVRCQKTAKALAEELVLLYEGRFAKAISLFKAGISDVLGYCVTRPLTTPRYTRRTCWSVCSRR